MIEYIKLFTAFIVSIGGSSVVVIGLAKYFGDFFAHRLLDSYNNRHEKELEGLKGKYATELEQTKTDLEKAKSRYMRYSEKQFELYNDLWRVLLYTKRQADALWEKADPQQIPSFSEQIRLTRNAINDNLLLIEEDHYNQLVLLIAKFEQFKFGKYKLVDIKSEDIDQPISSEDAQKTIRANKKTKDEYDSLIIDIGRSFLEIRLRANYACSAINRISIYY